MNLNQIAADNKERKRVRAAAVAGEWVEIHALGGRSVVENESWHFGCSSGNLNFVRFASRDDAAKVIDLLLSEIRFRDNMLTDLCQEKTAFLLGAETMRGNAVKLLRKWANDCKDEGMAAESEALFDAADQVGELLIPKPAKTVREMKEDSLLPLLERAAVELARHDAGHHHTSRELRVELEAALRQDD